MQQIVPAKTYLNQEERKALLRKSDFLALSSVTIHYAMIALAFAVAYIWPNPLTIILALWILGGQQLACAILMHDTSHYALFRSKRINDIIGQWLGAYPVFNNMRAYRGYHFKHHISNGLEDDPDLLLTRGYPTSRKSMLRKFFRDLSGQTGARALYGLILMHLGYLRYNLGGRIERVDQSARSWVIFWLAFRQNLLGPLLANLLLFLLFSLLASPWLYLLWIAAYLSTFQFCLRVRSMAEHSVVDDRENPYRNTRTTRANLLERLLFAPYNVNYHAEHHMLMGVPSYHLPRMHRLLRQRNYYERGVYAPGYLSVIQNAITD